MADRLSRLLPDPLTPPRRRPDRAFAILAGLTSASLLVAWSAGAEGGLAAAAFVLAATWIKARHLLDHYLGLVDSSGWRTGFSAALLVLLVSVLAVTALARGG